MKVTTDPIIARERIQAAFANVPSSFKERDAYEAACVSAGVEIFTDDRCRSLNGCFTFPEYEPESVIKCKLAELRKKGMKEKQQEDWDAEQDRKWEEKERARREGKPANETLKKEGQLWEPCKHCGHEPVYLPLFLCTQCWPS